MADEEYSKRATTADSSDDCNGIVLVHEGPDCAARAARLLSWYDASVRVAPHEEECDCADTVGRFAVSCPRCHGTGRRLVLDNPDAEFASARVVSVWRDWDVGALVRFAAERCQVIVTPDGEWHARGARGVQGWRDEVSYLLSDHAHFVALGYRFGLIDWQ